MMERVKQQRDYDEEPIIIKNDYLLKSELTTKILMLLLFIWVASINVIPEVDSGDELYRRLALGTAVVGIIVTIFGGYKFLFGLYRNELLIIVQDDKILYDYINKEGKKQTLMISIDSIKTVEWSYVPIFGEYDKIIDSTETFSDKFEFIIAVIPRFFLNTVFVFTFLVLKLFNIKKYYIFTTNKYILAIPENENLQKKVSNNIDGFSKITLMFSLLIKNSKIITGE